MPEQLTETGPAPEAGGPGVDAAREQGGPRRAAPQRATMLRQVLVILAAFAVAGALAGVAWEYLWTPSLGTVFDHRWLRDEQALADDFSAIGLYVLVGSVLGVLVGSAMALAFPRAEILTLLVVLVGSVFAGWLMFRVGVALGPADPRVLARTAADGVRLPADLRVQGWSAFGAFPMGALVGLVVVYLGRARDRGYRH